MAGTIIEFIVLLVSHAAAGIYSFTLRYSKKITYIIWGTWVAIQTALLLYTEFVLTNWALQFFVGFILTVWRLLRCNPFCKAGYDPVPDEGIVPVICRKKETHTNEEHNQNPREN